MARKVTATKERPSLYSVGHNALTIISLVTTIYFGFAAYTSDKKVDSLSEDKLKLETDLMIASSSPKLEVFRLYFNSASLSELISSQISPDLLAGARSYRVLDNPALSDVDDRIAHPERFPRDSMVEMLVIANSGESTAYALTGQYGGRKLNYGNLERQSALLVPIQTAVPGERSAAAAAPSRLLYEARFGDKIFERSSAVPAPAARSWVQVGFPAEAPAAPERTRRRAAPTLAASAVARPAQPKIARAEAEDDRDNSLEDILPK